VSDEILTADVWYSKECECPYCQDVMETDKESFDIETCLSCNKKFELGEFRL